MNLEPKTPKKKRNYFNLCLEEIKLPHFYLSNLLKTKNFAKLKFVNIYKINIILIPFKVNANSLKKKHFSLKM